MYILLCNDESYYVGSTKYLELRFLQHNSGKGANYTKARLPVHLVYFEEFDRIDKAFYREKQVQGWSRKKREALINGFPSELKLLAECMNDSHCRNYKGDFDSAQSPFDSAQSPFDSAQSPEG